MCILYVYIVIFFIVIMIWVFCPCQLVMSFQNSVYVHGVDACCELYTILFRIFCIFFNFAKSINHNTRFDTHLDLTFGHAERVR